MNTSASQLVLEIKQICGQYLEEVGSGGYRVWPKSIRDRALLLCDLVGSTKKAAEMCGISKETIYQWRAEAKKSHSKSFLNNKTRQWKVICTQWALSILSP